MNFEQAINSFFEIINHYVSSVFFFNVLFFIEGANLPLAVAWFFAAAFSLTIYFRFINIRYFVHAIKITFGFYDSEKSVGEVSHFKALSTALSATVGLGNIAGVAIAIASGGPGATFWMMLCGLLGMSSKFAECSLAQIYRKIGAEGAVLGGPMVYLDVGLKKINLPRLGKTLSVLFALLCICGSFGGGGSFQVNQSMNAMSSVIPWLQNYSWVYGLFIVVSVGLVIVGGIKRIANVAEMIVPVMCSMYIIMSLLILLQNFSEIPNAFSKIFYGAFSPDAMYGGFLGVLVQGMRRAAFSNEAGMGSAAIAHSTAKTTHPIQEGMVSLLEPFIDTVVICTMTALVMVITGTYNNPEYIDLIHKNQGAALTLKAYGSFHESFVYLLCAVIFMFAYSTIISWSYYGERTFVFLFGENKKRIYQVILLTVLFMGAIAQSTQVMEFGDLMILGMGFPNLIGVFLLRKEIKAALKDYIAKLA
ncbi:alanine:cation symporter family protein [bacterium]|nr:alanine:cation symporter family protein [bacterium]